MVRPQPSLRIPRAELLPLRLSELLWEDRNPPVDEQRHPVVERRRPQERELSCAGCSR